ncbi:hypothetical protein [Streptomyces griseus]|uniref:hypothetical protein n=1 Tax=Streptomyces griseus TaxID=1911 RepID=UPI0037F2601C
MTAYARLMLDANRYGDLRVVTGDGALGAVELRVQPRHLVDLGLDLPGTCWDQLAVEGLLVPLRWRGLSRSSAFRREKDRMTSESVKMRGFFAVIGQGGERNDHIDDDRPVWLYWDEDQPIESS